MYDEHDLIDFEPNVHGRWALGRNYIYRMPNTGWTLEVDDLNNSTVWDGEFATDQEALVTAMAEINAEGIEAFIASPPISPHTEHERSKNCRSSAN
ncbi:MAG: hypothetical protein R3E99_00445 [Burkholderiaceae bacterium]